MRRLLYQTAQTPAWPTLNFPPRLSDTNMAAPKSPRTWGKRMTKALVWLFLHSHLFGINNKFSKLLIWEPFVRWLDSFDWLGISVKSKIMPQTCDKWMKNDLVWSFYIVTVGIAVWRVWRLNIFGKGKGINLLIKHMYNR